MASAAVYVAKALRTYVRRAINCGVCARMCTLSCSTFVETVADGFSSEVLYDGPKCSLGALSNSWPFSEGIVKDWLLASSSVIIAVGKSERCWAEGATMLNFAGGKSVRAQKVMHSVGKHWSRAPLLISRVRELSVPHLPSQGSRQLRPAREELHVHEVNLHCWKSRSRAQRSSTHSDITSGFIATSLRFPSTLRHQAKHSTNSPRSSPTCPLAYLHHQPSAVSRSQLHVGSNRITATLQHCTRYFRDSDSWISMI